MCIEKEIIKLFDERIKQYQEFEDRLKSITIKHLNLSFEFELRYNAQTKKYEIVRVKGTATK
jgi:hypothetical protein